MICEGRCYLVVVVAVVVIVNIYMMILGFLFSSSRFCFADCTCHRVGWKATVD